MLAVISPTCKSEVMSFVRGRLATGRVFASPWITPLLENGVDSELPGLGVEDTKNLISQNQYCGESDRVSCEESTLRNP